MTHRMIALLDEHLSNGITESGLRLEIRRVVNVCQTILFACCQNSILDYKVKVEG
jgi:hypothetical protein